jgi:hypothetical protein
MLEVEILNLLGFFLKAAKVMSIAFLRKREAATMLPSTEKESAANEMISLVAFKSIMRVYGGWTANPAIVIDNQLDMPVFDGHKININHLLRFIPEALLPTFP